MAPHSDAGPAPPQHLAPRRSLNYWVAFAATIIVLFPLAFWAVYSPSQDHIGAIPLRGDGTWYYNYERNFEIQDNDIFFHGIGRSIRNAQLADISARPDPFLLWIGGCSSNSNKSTI
jgi:hypothetical protein